MSIVITKGIYASISRMDLVLEEAFKLSRAVGTFPFNSKYIDISYFKLMQAVILFSLSTISSLLTIYSSTFLNQIIQEKVVYLLLVLPLNVFNCVNLVWLLINRKVIQEVYDDLRDVENDLRRNGVNWYYKYSWLQKYMSFTFITIVIIMFGITSDYKNHILIPKLFSYLSTYPVMYTITGQYIGLLSIIRSLLRQIKSLEENEVIVKLKENLFTISEKINSCYEPQILLYNISIFVTVLFGLYTRYLNPSSPWYLFCTWLITSLYPLMHIIISFGLASEEGKKLNKMLYRRLLANANDETLEFHLIAKRDIVFTACGFFNFENSLICSMIKTGTTYLVILLQYTQKS